VINTAKINYRINRMVYFDMKLHEIGDYNDGR